MATAVDKAFDRQHEALEDLRVALNRSWYVSLDEGAPESYSDELYDAVMTSFDAALEPRFSLYDAIEAEEKSRNRKRQARSASPSLRLVLGSKFHRKKDRKGRKLPKGPFTPAQGSTIRTEETNIPIGAREGKFMQPEEEDS